MGKFGQEVLLIFEVETANIHSGISNVIQHLSEDLWISFDENHSLSGVIAGLAIEELVDIRFITEYAAGMHSGFFAEGVLGNDNNVIQIMARNFPDWGPVGNGLLDHPLEVLPLLLLPSQSSKIRL